MSAAQQAAAPVLNQCHPSRGFVAMGIVQMTEGPEGAFSFSAIHFYLYQPQK